MSLGKLKEIFNDFHLIDYDIICRTLATQKENKQRITLTKDVCHCFPSKMKYSNLISRA